MKSNANFESDSRKKPTLLGGRFLVALLLPCLVHTWGHLEFFDYSGLAFANELGTITSLNFVFHPQNYVLNVYQLGNGNESCLVTLDYIMSDTGFLVYNKDPEDPKRVGSKIKRGDHVFFVGPDRPFTLQETRFSTTNVRHQAMVHEICNEEKRLTTVDEIQDFIGNFHGYIFMGFTFYSAVKIESTRMVRVEGEGMNYQYLETAWVNKENYWKQIKKKLASIAKVNVQDKDLGNTLLDLAWKRASTLARTMGGSLYKKYLRLLNRIDEDKRLQKLYEERLKREALQRKNKPKEELVIRKDYITTNFDKDKTSPIRPEDIVEDDYTDLNADQPKGGKMRILMKEKKGKKDKDEDQQKKKPVDEEITGDFAPLFSEFEDNLNVEDNSRVGSR